VIHTHTPSSLLEKDQTELTGFHVGCLLNSYQGRQVCQACSGKDTLTNELKTTIKKLNKLVTDEIPIIMNTSQIITTTDTIVHVACLQKSLDGNERCSSCDPHIYYLRQKLSKPTLNSASRLPCSEEIENIFRFIIPVFFITVMFAIAPYYNHDSPS
jgi:hypothetical protein